MTLTELSRTSRPDAFLCKIQAEILGTSRGLNGWAVEDYLKLSFSLCSQSRACSPG